MKTILILIPLPETMRYKVNKISVKFRLEIKSLNECVVKRKWASFL